MEKVIFVELYQAGVAYSTDPAQGFTPGLQINYCERVEFETMRNGQIAVVVQRSGTRSRLLYRGHYRVLVSEELMPLS